MKQKNKLMEVALPLDAINKASVREKSIKHPELLKWDLNDIVLR